MILSEAEYIEMAENIDLKVPTTSNHNGNEGSGSNGGNGHGGGHNGEGYHQKGSGYHDHGQWSGNQSPQHNKSPSSFGKKTNNTLGYSSGPCYPHKAGLSNSRPPHSLLEIMDVSPRNMY